MIPNELDFFKYAQGGTAKRKSDQPGTQHSSKKRKIDGDSESEDEEEEAAESSTPAQSNPATKHRVTCKGDDVPEAADTFQALAERYHLSSLLMSNLSKHGYTYPTGIQ